MGPSETLKYGCNLLGEAKDTGRAALRSILRLSRVFMREDIGLCWLVSCQCPRAYPPNDSGENTDSSGLYSYEPMPT